MQGAVLKPWEAFTRQFNILFFISLFLPWWIFLFSYHKHTAANILCGRIALLCVSRTSSEK